MPNGSVLCWGWSGATWTKILVDGTGHLQVDVLSTTMDALAATAANQVLINANLATLVTEQGRCYGWSGAAWRTLLTEDDTDFNLRVKLYDGATGLGFWTPTGARMPDTTPILPVATWAISYSRYPLWDDRTDTDTLTTDGTARHRSCIAKLYGFDGTNFARIRCGAPADALATSGYALDTRCFLMGYDGTDWNMVRVDAAGHLQVDILSSVGLAADLRALVNSTPTLLAAYTGGILKVARAEAGLSDVYCIADTLVKDGAGQVYWISLYAAGINSFGYLRDGSDVGGAIKVTIGAPVFHNTVQLVFDPPLEFATGIFWDNAGGAPAVTIGYM